MRTPWLRQNSSLRPDTERSFFIRVNRNIEIQRDEIQRFGAIHHQSDQRNRNHESKHEHPVEKKER